MASSTELLCYSSFVLFQNKEKCYVDKADPIRLFFGIREDLERLALGSWFAQLCQTLCPQGTEAGEILRLLLNSLHMLEKGNMPLPQLKALTELRLLTLSGYMPDLVACRECGCFKSDSMTFLPISGELLCGDCAGEGGQEGALPVSRGVLAAMRHIIYAPAAKLYSFSLSPEGQRQLERLSEAYLCCQLERSFPTLDFYHSLMIGL